ncbi:hypothetical protein ABKN59_007929 [Abortiporus biennis]
MLSPMLNSRLALVATSKSLLVRFGVAPFVATVAQSRGAHNEQAHWPHPLKSSTHKDSARLAPEYDPTQGPTLTYTTLADEQPSQSKGTVMDRDAAMANALKEKEGTLANARFENGQVEEGLSKNVRANVFRSI